MTIANNIKTFENMIFGELEISTGEKVLVVGHNDKDPNDYEWNQYLNYCAMMIDRYKMSKAYIHSIGGGPSKNQIQKMMNSTYVKWQDNKINPKVSIYSSLGDNWTVNATLRMKVVLISGVMYLKGVNYIKYTTNKIEALKFAGLSSDATLVSATSEYLQEMLKTNPVKGLFS